MWWLIFRGKLTEIDMHIISPSIKSSERNDSDDNVQLAWAIILCRFNDKLAVPQPRQYYIDFFAQNGMGGACDYWRVVSCNSLDLTGSQVFGWFTMNHSSSEVAQMHFPSERYKLVRWWIDTSTSWGHIFWLSENTSLQDRKKRYFLK